MANLTMSLAPHVLTFFMLLLAGVPLALVWQDSRRRAQASQRLSILRREARISAQLRGGAAPVAGFSWKQPARG